MICQYNFNKFYIILFIITGSRTCCKSKIPETKRCHQETSTSFRCWKLHQWMLRPRLENGYSAPSHAFPLSIPMWRRQTNKMEETTGSRIDVRIEPKSPGRENTILQTAVFVPWGSVNGERNSLCWTISSFLSKRICFTCLQYHIQKIKSYCFVKVNLYLSLFCFINALIVLVKNIKCFFWLSTHGKQL